MKFYDEEGNEYTADQVRAAADAKAKDEAGEGSFGGLNDDQDGAHTPTTAPVAAPARTDEPLEPAKAGTKINPEPKDPNARELNPLNFGKFISDNVFGGFNGKYITGKRPMTLFDYATDAAAAYSGEDLASRNSKIISADAARTRAVTEAEKNRREGEKFELEKKKAGLEVDKMTSEAVSTMMNDYDSDLWPAHLKSLQKEHGLNIPPATINMVTRMTEGLNKEGATSPAEVLENKDKFSPELFNRVRHTMTLLNKNVQESQKRDLETQRSEQALGMRAGPEKRQQEKYTQEQSGVEGAKALLADDLASDDPTTRNRARARLAAINAGGANRQKVIEEMTGIESGSGGRGLGIKVTRDAAIAELQQEKGGPSYQPTPNEIKDRMQVIEARGAAEKTEATKTAGMVAEGKASAARALGQLSNLRELGSKILTRSALASYGQPIEFFFKRRFRNEEMAELQAVPGTLSNLARAMGEKGVLTEGDLIRIANAVQPADNDTWQTYSARLAFVERMIVRGQQRLEQAARTGRIDPAWSSQDSKDIQIDYGTAAQPAQPARTGESASGVSKTSEGTTDRQSLAVQWSAKIKAEKDPAKRAMLEQKAVEELAQ